MKLLYIVPYAPSMIRVRPYSFLQTLARLDCRVTLATLFSDDLDLHSLSIMEKAGIQTFGFPTSQFRSIRNCIRALPGKLPLQAVYSWEPRLAEKVVELLKDELFDGILVEHIRGALYGHLALRVVQKLPDLNKIPPIIWDSVDCISYLHEQSQKMAPSWKKRLISRWERSRTASFENTSIQFFDHIIVTAERDLEKLLQSTLGKQNNSGARGLGWFLDRFASMSVEERNSIGINSAGISVIANGVDTDYFSPVNQKRDQGTILMTGKMSYHANQAGAIFMIEEIMPRVWKHCPEVKLQIVGKDPPKRMREYQRRWPPSKLEVTGYVPDIRPYLQRATLAVAPLPYAVGIQSKALEAMACETPLIATSTVAEGIRALPGSDFVIQDDPVRFADEVIRLLEDKSLRERIGKAARRFVKNNHSWRNQGLALLELFRRIRRSQHSE